MRRQSVRSYRSYVGHRYVNGYEWLCCTNKEVGVNDVSDAEALPDLLQDVPGEIEHVSADGAYDQRRCYDTLNRHGVRAAVPPRKGARIWSHANGKAERHVRDENLRLIR